MIDMVYKIGYRRGVTKLAATVSLPQAPKLFGTMKPAANLAPARKSMSAIKAVTPSTDLITPTKNTSKPPSLSKL